MTSSSNLDLSVVANMTAQRHAGAVVRNALSTIGLLLAALAALAPDDRCAFGVEAPRPYGAVPSQRHLAWHDRQFYAFVHFNMNTFTGVEWGSGTESPNRFHPTELNCRQWCALFKECGLTGVILTAKHHDGFCLWPSKVPDHDVESCSWRDGKGDVVKDLAEACREYGLFLGVYISPWDRNNPLYGRRDAAYNDYFVGQLEELLSDYGPIAEVWWDGANGDRGNPDKHQEYDWPRFIETVRRLQPNAVIFAPPYAPGDIRWVGNEQGRAAVTQWATYPANTPEDAARQNTGLMGAKTWMPAETDVSIRPGWYWTEASDSQVKSCETLLDIYYRSVGRNTNLLLNIPVDTRGLVNDSDARALRSMASVLRATFQRDLARGKKASASSSRGRGFTPDLLTDGSADTYWAAPDDVTAAELEVDLDEPILFNRIALQEHVELGQRVKRWRLDALQQGEWKKLSAGTTIGHLRLIRCDSVEATRLRLVIEESAACPTIQAMCVYYAPAPVP